MARILNGRRQAPGTTLTREQLREAQRQLARATRENPLRVARLACHGPARDPSARVGDWIWCEQCGDFARVESVSA
jgi:hypothetical protein